MLERVTTNRYSTLKKKVQNRGEWRCWSMILSLNRAPEEKEEELGYITILKNYKAKIFAKS